jgi:hypothetical protein
MVRSKMHGSVDRKDVPYGEREGGGVHRRQRLPQCQCQMASVSWRPNWLFRGLALIGRKTVIVNNAKIKGY